MKSSYPSREKLPYYTLMQAEDAVREMKEFFASCARHPDSGDTRHECLRYKRALVYAATICKRQGNFRLAKIYEDGYKQMILPPKGKYFRPHPEDWG
jgi:hypothetical protein